MIGNIPTCYRQAHFVLNPNVTMHELTVNTVGQGTVNSHPQAAINCQPQCQAYYREGQKVKLQEVYKR